MKVILRNPRKEIEVDGKRRVKELLVELDILPSTVLVIRGNELLTGDTVVGGDDVLEVPERHLPRIRIIATVVGGRIEYRA